MLLPRRRVLGILLAVGVLALGLGFYTWRQAHPSFEALCARVDGQVEKYRCTPTELAHRQIAWVDDLGDAFDLARKHVRPVFLMAVDGSMCTGRI